MKEEKAALNAAASRIQASFKGAKAREALPQVRLEAEERRVAIVKLQARVRGAIARRLHDATMRSDSK